MRHEKAALLLDLARRLASSAEGLTLDEMAEAAGVGRRTAERMRDAIWDLFPQLEEVPDGPTKRFRITGGLGGLFQAPTTEELLDAQGFDNGHELAGDPLAVPGTKKFVDAAIVVAHRRRAFTGTLGFCPSLMGFPEPLSCFCHPVRRNRGHSHSRSLVGIP